MKSAFKVLTVLLVCTLLFCSCSSSNSPEVQDNSPTENADIDVTDASQNVSEQIQEIASENATVEVGEYAVPDAASFDTNAVEGGVSICQYHGDLKSVIIPETIDGAKVVAIESGAFTNAEVTGVKIPDSVTQINEKAFYFCMTIVEVEFGSGVLEVGDEAFEGCFALTKVSLNQGLKSIGEMAFGNTPSLVDVSLPDSLEFMGEGAFVLSGIKELTIPGSVKTIEEQVFSTCSNLERIVLEDGVESIKHNAFEDCGNLVSVEIPASVTEIESLAFLYTEQVTIIAPANSVAETFAREAELNFSAK